jgi:hypothetical protein
MHYNALTTEINKIYDLINKQHNCKLFPINIKAESHIYITDIKSNKNSLSNKEGEEEK